jgi:hypothetical protein
MERVQEGDWAVAEASAEQPARRKRKPFARSMAAAAGIFSGIASLFIGLVCVVVHVAVQSDKVFDRVGSILLICAIPLMLTGSLFLDEAAPK